MDEHTKPTILSNKNKPRIDRYSFRCMMKIFTCFTCSGFEIPKPTATGFSVTCHTRQSVRPISIAQFTSTNLWLLKVHYRWLLSRHTSLISSRRVWTLLLTDARAPVTPTELTYNWTKPNFIFTICCHRTDDDLSSPDGIWLFLSNLKSWRRRSFISKMSSQEPFGEFEGKLNSPHTIFSNHFLL